MGCGDSGCHGPSLAYQAAADISSRTSSREEVQLYANLTAISDMLRGRLEDQREAQTEAHDEAERQDEIVRHLEEALMEIEAAQAL